MCPFISLRWCRILSCDTKLYGSFKGDAFDKRVLPFFHECNDVYLGVLLTRLRGMPWNASAVELRFEAP